MMSPYMLMGALMQETAEAARTRRRRVVMGMVMVVIGVAGLAVTAWIIARAVVYGWQTADWWRLDSASFLPIPFLFLIVAALSRTRWCLRVSRQPQSCAALRSAKANLHRRRRRSRHP